VIMTEKVTMLEVAALKEDKVLTIQEVSLEVEVVQME